MLSHAKFLHLPVLSSPRADVPQGCPGFLAKCELWNLCPTSETIWAPALLSALHPDTLAASPYIYEASVVSDASFRFPHQGGKSAQNSTHHSRIDPRPGKGLTPRSGTWGVHAHIGTISSHHMRTPLPTALSAVHSTTPPGRIKSIGGVHPSRLQP